MQYDSWIARRLLSSGTTGFTRIILWIATGAVGLSIAVMILAFGLMTGFKHEITQKMFGFWGHVHISDPRIIRSYEALPFVPDTQMVNSIKNTDIIEWNESGKLKRTKGGVSNVSSFIYLPGIIKSEDQLEGIVLKGIDEAYDWRMMNEFRAEEDDPWTNLGEDELLISAITANRLNLKKGDKLIVYFVRDGNQILRRFTIKGMYKTGLEENDTKFALASMTRLRDILGWDSLMVSGLEVVVDHVDDIDHIANYIYQDELPPELYAETVKEKFPSLFEWLSLQDINTVVIIALMMAVAIINMITALLILIIERTQMVGILKSLGARQRNIRRIFLWFALGVTAGGILIGNILGIGLGWLQDKYKFIKLDEADYYLSYAPVMILPWHVLAVNLGSFVLIGLCLIGPTYLIGKINPVQTIHFK